MPPRLFLRRLALTLAIGLGTVLTSAQADGGLGRTARGPELKTYQQECAACHTAYPPGALPAASWQRLMGNLNHHFGSDASLDPAVVKSLSTWLSANAASSGRARETPPEDRITRSAWFVRQHNEISPSVWKRASIKSAANCAACHTRADQGDFDEDNVRIPR